MLDAPKDYLLIVTNKELGASKGTTLAAMYPPILTYPDEDAKRFLPLENIYVLSIEEFERLVTAARDPGFDLPGFVDQCVATDHDSASAVYYFEQHLDEQRIPLGHSSLVTGAIKNAEARLERALHPSSSTGPGT